MKMSKYCIVFVIVHVSPVSIWWRNIYDISSNPLSLRDLDREQKKLKVIKEVGVDWLLKKERKQVQRGHTPGKSTAF